jgi:hypothetical protein
MKGTCIFCLTLMLSLSVRSQEITLAITDCNVIPMKSDAVLYHQTILISNDKILKILPAKEWVDKKNTRTINGSGKYVIPALADMHIHANQYSNWIFPLLLSYGVTTIRVMSGNEAVLKWRDSVRNNLKIAPDIHSASQLIDGNPPAWGNLHDGPVVQNADSVEWVITDQISRGYEFIKAYNRLSPEVFKRIRSVCVEKNIKLACHIPPALNKNDILTADAGEIEHLSGYVRYASKIDSISNEAAAKNSEIIDDLELANNVSPDKMRIAARKTKEYNIWNCPTLIIHAIKSDTSFCKELPAIELGQKLTPVLGWWKSQGYHLDPAEKKLLDFKKAMVKELDLNKTFLLAGSDSPVPWVVPGLSIHQELQYMVAAGLSNYDALKTATVNPATWFGKNYDKGIVEAGKRADLIILSANPLEDIHNTLRIVSVVFKGEVVER